MKKVLIDLNVILDFLTRRKNHKNAAMVFNLIENKKIKGYVAVHEITTLAYFLEKEKIKTKEFKNIINEILDLYTLVNINESMLRSALESEIKDFEDAVLEQAGLKENLEFIVTNNIKDFTKGKIEAITPEQLVGIIS